MQANSFLEIDQKMAGDIYTSSEVMDNLTVLCDDFGSRFGGTEGEKQAVEFMQAKLREYGLQNVQAEPFEYIGWRRGQAKLEIISPIEKEIPCITLPHSPPADIEAVICDVGDGGPTDFERLQDQIAGKFAMVNSKTQPRDSQRWVHRSEKYGQSLVAGATGFIFVNHYPAYGPATGGMGRDDEALIPCISVSYEDGAFLQRLMQRKGEVKIRLKSTDFCETMTSWNVTAEIPGSAANPEIVMLGSHYDGHDIAQGAHDPASGAVSVIEAARVLAKYAGSMAHTVRFALWGVEEIGLIGSRLYVQQHADELDNLRFYFNMDAAGGNKPKDVVINEWPALEALFKGWQQEMALDFMVGQSVHTFSDHFPFFTAGVPTGGMEMVEKDLSGRGYGHTHYDTLDKVQIKGLREASTLAARLAVRIANEEAWPVSRRSEESVQDLFDKPEYREAHEIREKITAYINAR